MKKSCTTNQNILISHINLVDLKKLSLFLLKVAETLLLFFTLVNLKKLTDTLLLFFTLICDLFGNALAFRYLEQSREYDKVNSS